MSEVMKCDQCEKIVPTGETLKRSKRWWRVETLAFDGEEGGDFCSDVCARNFFADRVIAALPKKRRSRDPDEKTAAETCPLSPPCQECVESKRPGPRRGEHLYNAAHTDRWDCTRENPCKFCADEKKPVIHEIDYKAKAHPGVVLEPETPKEQETSGAGSGRNGTVPEGVV